MAPTYLLVDLNNLFFRAKHGIRGDIDTKLGMSLHVVFNSIKKVWHDFHGSHIVVCLEGRSWRKDVYAPYKANRAAARASLTPQEQEDDQVFWEVFKDFENFLRDKTNCTVLQHPQLEADDLIAGFIQMNPDANHVIISTDTDFLQLIAPNVSQYNGVLDTHITHTGYFDAKGRPIKDTKTGELRPAPDPEWELFLKCIRGDPSDNLFSAYPGVRVKGTKNKTGLMEAFSDRKSKGFAWNNIMLSRWTDHNGVEHRVMDDYLRNVQLVDLRAQPPEIRAMIESTIKENAKPKNISQVGVRMLKFCQLYDLKRISDSIQLYATPFSANYV